MSTTTQRQRIDTAFRSTQAAMTIPIPMAPQKKESLPVRQPGARTRTQVQAAWLGLSLFTSCLILACGMLYLYGCASLAKETMRAAHLMTQRKQEQAHTE